VYEVDGGEWLDFVSADLKHLTPRPERVRGNGAAAQPREEAAAAEESPEEAAPVADVIMHPAAEPAELAPVESTPEAEPAAAPPEPVQEVNYEPDQERRDKFFSRLSRWAKK
jgi:hypothetical protein